MTQLGVTIQCLKHFYSILFYIEPSHRKLINRGPNPQKTVMLKSKKKKSLICRKSPQQKNFFKSKFIKNLTL